MKETIIAMMPQICVGLAMLIFVAKYATERIKKKKGEEVQETFMVEGMFLGLIVGAAIGGMAPGIAMLVGLFLGMRGKKDKKDRTEKDANDIFKDMFNKHMW